MFKPLNTKSVTFYNPQQLFFILSFFWNMYQAFHFRPWIANITCTELCEMVSVLGCILPSLVSVESMSWRQFLPLPHSLLVHYLTHPLARLTLEILFIALSGFSSAGPIRSISAPFEKRITNISPLKPQTPHVQWHQWIPLKCQDEYVCKCFFYQLMCFSHSLCLATAPVQFGTLLNPGEKKWMVNGVFWVGRHGEGL